MTVAELNQQRAERARASPKWGFRSPYWLLLLAILGIVAIRFVNLGADTPADLPGEPDQGLYVDEGYKTLSARNLVVFGNTRWSPDDDYPGWMKASPVTQRAFFLAFSTLGQNIESARVVSVVWFALFLIVFALVFYGKYPTVVFWSGLLIIGFHHVLWVFSRVAIFEIAVICCLFGALLILQRFTRNLWRGATMLMITGAITLFAVKLNAAYILLPALFGITASVALEKWGQRKFLLFCLFGAVLCFIPVATVKLGYTLPISLTSATKKVDLFPVTQLLDRFVSHPILRADPFVVILGHACALGLLLHRPGSFAGNPYRCGIMSVVFLGTAILAFMGQGILRYYVLILPAFILLTLEWWAEQRNVIHRSDVPMRWPALRNTAAIIVLVMLIFDCLFVLGWGASRFLAMLNRAGWSTWPLLAVAIAATFPVWIWRRSLLSEDALRRFSFVVLLAFALFNTYKVSGYFLRPTWQLKSISREITRILPADAVIAGDWAPLFAIGTNFRVLYMDSRMNRPERIKLLRPSHFLSCETDDGKRVKDIIEQTDGVVMGQPLLKSEYNGRQVALYPLKYREPQDTPTGL